jgi:hypothetical protein
MEESDARNLDCVHMSVQYIFSGPQTDSSCCAEANIVPGTILLPTSLLITGSAVQNHLFWLAPDVASQWRS